MSTPEKQLLLHVFDGLRNCVWIGKSATEVQWANPSWHHLFGEEAPAYECRQQRMHPADRKNYVAICQSVLDTGQPAEVSYRIGGAEADKTRVWRSITEELQRQQVDGEPVLIGIIDGTPSPTRTGAAALDRPLEAMNEVVDALPDPLFVKDEAHRWLILNDAFCRFLGYPREELLGKSDYDFFSEEEADVFWAVDNMVFETGRPHENEEKLTDANGRTAWIHTRKSLVELNDGHKILVGVISDITTQRKAEQDRERIQTQMLHTQKLESLGVLAGGIAHDFNNLLLVILGNAQLCQLEVASGSTADAAIEKISIAARRAADLCQQLLAYSGSGQVMVEPVDLPSLIGEMTHIMALSVSKKVELVVDVGEEIAPIRGDAAQISQIFMNLISNASQAIGDRPGKIKVRIRCVDADQELLGQSVLEDELPAGRYVQLEVEDDGCGMDKATQSRIFDPFFSTRFQGRGLGLAAVLGIVRSHGGALTIKSEPGVGTTFRVLFPAALQANAEPRQISSDSLPAFRFSHCHTILVADDEPGVRDLCRNMLEAEGFEVILASNGPDAVTQLKRHARAVDVALLDVNMPGLSGPEVFASIRDSSLNIPVLFMSGFNKDDIQTELKHPRVHGFLHKPFSRRTLLSRLARALGA